MARQRVVYHSNVCLGITACDCIILCLTAAWDAKVTSGVALVNATVVNSIRKLGVGGRFFGRCSYDPRNSGVIQYAFDVDDSQFTNDPETEAPWILTCADIVEVNANCCTVGKLLAQ